MSKILDIDPVTRIEGHLSVRVEVTDGTVTDAFCSGEMFRGYETIICGRHPMDAQQIMQRICGVCPVEHGVASALAQDQAYGIQPAPNGLFERNIVQAANFLHSHILHFYVLSAIDFLDVTTILDYPGQDAGMCELRDWVKGQIASKVYLPAAPFLPRYEAKYLEDKSMNLTLLQHYLEALDVRRCCHQLGALFAGKLPHAAAIIPGGMSQPVDAIRIAAAEGFLEKIRHFVERCYIPDVVAVSGKFPDYWHLGRGNRNYLAYGVFPEDPAGHKKMFPGGVLVNGKLDAVDIGLIREDVGYSWFQDAPGKPPHSGETVPDVAKQKAYSWVKAPRYNGLPMEVGALPRLLIAQAAGHEPGRSALDKFLAATGKSPEDMASVMGRHAARALESGLLVAALERWIACLRPDEPSSVSFQIPDKGEGVGLTEAARGALGHWLQIEKRVVSRYQCVVPTTWNCSPKDDRGVRGPVEEALVGSKVADEANPIEAVRIVRSFDPCLACAVH